MPTLFRYYPGLKKEGWVQLRYIGTPTRSGDIVLRDLLTHPETIANAENNGNTSRRDGWEVQALDGVPCKGISDLFMNGMHGPGAPELFPFTVWRKIRPGMVMEEERPFDGIVEHPLPVEEQHVDRGLVPFDVEQLFQPRPEIPSWKSYLQVTDYHAKIQKNMVFLWALVADRPPPSIVTHKIDNPIGFRICGPAVLMLEGKDISFFDRNYADRPFTVWKPIDIERVEIYPQPAAVIPERQPAINPDWADAVMRMPIPDVLWGRPKKKPFTPKLVKNKFHSTPLPLP